MKSQIVPNMTMTRLVHNYIPKCNLLHFCPSVLLVNIKVKVKQSHTGLGRPLGLQEVDMTKHIYNFFLYHTL
jgi:hypothetical protein